MKKRFIAQQGGKDTIKVFEAETGQLYRVITVSGNITSPPICTESEMYVGITDSSGTTNLVYYNVPNFSMIRSITL